MPKTPRIRAKDFFKYLKKYGCTATTINGSHHKVTYKDRTSVVAIHTNEILFPGMFIGILKQLNINVNEFVEFIDKN